MKRFLTILPAPVSAAASGSRKRHAERVQRRRWRRDLEEASFSQASRRASDRRNTCRQDLVVRQRYSPPPATGIMAYRRSSRHCPSSGSTTIPPPPADENDGARRHAARLRAPPSPCGRGEKMRIVSSATKEVTHVVHERMPWRCAASASSRTARPKHNQRRRRLSRRARDRRARAASFFSSGSDVAEGQSPCGPRGRRRTFGEGIDSVSPMTCGLRTVHECDDGSLNAASCGGVMRRAAPREQKTIRLPSAAADLLKSRRVVVSKPPGSLECAALGVAGRGRGNCVANAEAARGGAPIHAARTATAVAAGRGLSARGPYYPRMTSRWRANRRPGAQASRDPRADSGERRASRGQRGPRSKSAEPAGSRRGSAAPRGGGQRLSG